MTNTDTIEPRTSASAADHHDPSGEFLTALGRVYLDAGLPLAAAFEAALADCAIFDLQSSCRP